MKRFTTRRDQEIWHLSIGKLNIGCPCTRMKMSFKLDRSVRDELIAHCRLILLPSRAVWHQADPITKGTRWALVIFYDVD